MATYLCKVPKSTSEALPLLPVRADEGLVCADQNITREGPTMVKRTMAILVESQNIWPLASRWLEGLGKAAIDHKSDVSGNEVSMADGVSLASGRPVFRR